MKMVVCVKQTLDPEIPPQDFRIDPEQKRPVQGSAKLVLDSFAEYALEVALQLKEKVPGSKVIALAVADQTADEVLRRALAMTADDAVRVWDSRWADLDAHAVAHVLAQAIRHLGGADLVLCGRQSSDIERGLVGPMLAEELGWGCTTAVSRVEVAGDRVRLRREADDGLQVVEAPLPHVITVTNDETNVPRQPKVKDLLMAKRRAIQVLGAADLALDESRMTSAVVLEDLFVPHMDGGCELIPGDDGPAMAVNLARKLQEMKLL